MLLSHLPDETEAADEDRWELHLTRAPWKLAHHYGPSISHPCTIPWHRSRTDQHAIARSDFFRTVPGGGEIDQGEGGNERRLLLNAWEEKFTFFFRAVEKSRHDGVGDES